MKVNYGCGNHAPDGWLNFDSSPRLRLERLPLLGRFISAKFPANVRFGDIVRGLPIPDDSVQCVIASHVLEHLTREDFCTALQNTFRMMQSGGKFRIIMPDLSALVATYSQHVAEGKRDANDFFLRSSFLGRERPPHTLMEHLHEWFGAGHHLWMWDWPSVSDRLQDCGFFNIRRCKFGDNPDFHGAEIGPRFDWAVSAEATKP
jgi:hypothetical protein